MLVSNQCQKDKVRRNPSSYPLRFYLQNSHILLARPAGFEPATRGLEVRKAASKGGSDGATRDVNTPPNIAS